MEQRRLRRAGKGRECPDCRCLCFGDGRQHCLFCIPHDLFGEPARNNLTLPPVPRYRTLILCASAFCKFREDILSKKALVKASAFFHTEKVLFLTNLFLPISSPAALIKQKSKVTRTLLFCWCGRRDLNPYDGITRPSNVRVCQFRHSRGRLLLYTK